MEIKLKSKNTSLDQLKELTDSLNLRDYDLMKNFKMYSMILNQIPEMIIFLSDKNFIFTECFGKGLEQINLSSKDFIGKGVYDLPSIIDINEDDFFKMVKEYKLLGDCIHSYNFKFRGSLWGLTIDTLLDDNKNHIGFIGVFIKDVRLIK